MALQWRQCLPPGRLAQAAFPRSILSESHFRDICLSLGGQLLTTCLSNAVETESSQLLK